jgi:hypothetical protein
MEEVTGGWKWLHIDEISRKILGGGGGADATNMGEMTSAYKILVDKSEGKILCGRPRHTW